MSDTGFATRLARAVFLCALIIATAACGDDNREERLRKAGTNPSFQDLMQVADAKAGAHKFRQCAACHSIIEGATDRSGPNLYGVFGKPFASNRARYGYTAALASAGGTWNEHTLDAWLADPAKLVPGTTMQVSVKDPLTRADIIAYLREQR